MERFRIFLEKSAFKQIEKLSEDTRNRITEALHTLRDEGFSRRLDIKKLRGYRNQLGFGWVNIEYCLNSDQKEQ